MTSAVVRCVDNEEILVESTGKTIAASCYQLRGFDKVQFDIFVAAHEQDDITSAIKTHQYMFPEPFSLLLDLVRPGYKVLDLGSHIGTFSLLAAALGCQVLGVEASPVNAALFSEGVRRNGFDAIQVIPAAVSDRNGELEFIQDGPYGMVASPLRDGTSIAVPAITVDALLADAGWDTVDFIKMDVEGAEVAVVQGMQHLLAREDAPMLMYESNGHTLHHFGETPASLMASLENFGYRCYYVSAGLLIPWRSADFQPEVCVDYLATKRPLDAFSYWKLAPPMGVEEKITKLLTSCADPDKNVRVYIARTMADVAATMLPDLRIAGVLNVLKMDVDDDVRSAMGWWRFDVSVSAHIHELCRVLAEKDAEIARLRALVQGYESGRFMRMMRFFNRVWTRLKAQ